ncbi:MAG: rRNA maturation RNase YbeY [Nitrospiria bacterium]
MNNKRIWILNRQRKFKIDLNKIRKVADIILNEMGQEKMALSLLFVNARAIRKINREFRHINLPTDVLSFPVNHVFPHSDRKFLGDIVISVESARKQALNLGHSLDREIAFLLIHGILHLLDWDHERSPREAKSMYQKQRSLLTVVEGVNCKMNFQ